MLLLKVLLFWYSSCVSGWICLLLCLFPAPPATRTRMHTHAHTDLAGMLLLALAAQQGTATLSAVPFLHCAARSSSTSLLTLSCRGLQGFFVCFKEACMPMSWFVRVSWRGRARPCVCEFCLCMIHGVKQGSPCSTMLTLLV